MLSNKLSRVIVLFVTLFLISCSEDDPVAPSEEHFEAAGFVIKDESGEILFKVLNGSVDVSVSEKFTLENIDVEEHYDIEFLDENGEDIGTPSEEDGHSHEDEEVTEVTVETEEDHSLFFEMEDNSLLEYDIEGWELHITPKVVGNTNFRIQILHEGHPDFTSPFVPLEVK